MSFGVFVAAVGLVVIIAFGGLLDQWLGPWGFWAVLLFVVVFSVEFGPLVRWLVRRS